MNEPQQHNHYRWLSKTMSACLRDILDSEKFPILTSIIQQKIMHVSFLAYVGSEYEEEDLIVIMKEHEKIMVSKNILKAARLNNFYSEEQTE